MNRMIQKILTVLRYKIVKKIIGVKKKICVESNRTIVSNEIIRLLKSDSPCMIARYGAFEGSVVLNYTGIQTKKKSYYKYITWQTEAWWWNRSLLKSLSTNAGFFPLKEELVNRYCALMLKDSADLDMVGCFDNNDNAERLSAYHNNCKYVRLACIEPEFTKINSSSEWTSSLKGKRVLVIHPFAETIQAQYDNRSKLFPDPNFLPEFKLLTIKAVQSIGGACSDFATWFDALKFMEDEMDKMDYDIAIIGCGAYGFNLAAHAKRTGHKAIHLGGSTQLLFGIRGKRWDKREDLQPIMNEYWVHPSPKDIPDVASKIENGCYW